MSIISQFAEAAPYYTTQQDTVSDAAVAGALATFLIFSIIVTITLYAITAYLTSRIFKKAGVEEWKAWVPIYNNWVLLELGGQKGFWAVLQIIPVINLITVVFIYIAQYHIGLKLGKEGTFVLLAIFLPLVWLIWLAVDSSKWKGAPKHATHKDASALSK